MKTIIRYYKMKNIEYEDIINFEERELLLDPFRWNYVSRTYVNLL